MSDKATQRGVGKPGFVSEYGLVSDAEAVERTKLLIKEHDLRTIRMVWVDQHGAARCKFMSVPSYLASLENGIDFSGALYSLDTANQVFPPAFAEGGGFGIPEFTGFPDIVLVPDPGTFTVLPFADRTGWVLTDAYFNNGTPVPFDARRLLRLQTESAAEMGFDYISGIEVEFYIVRPDTPGHIGLDETGWPPPTPKVTAVEQGYQYLSEVRLSGINGVLEKLRDAFTDMNLPLRSIEDEWGPGQVEITFDPMANMDTADTMILFRSATKQICQSLGLHATFMCRPALPNFAASGWHLHESLRSLDSGANAFTSDDDQPLSDVGRHFVAGILEHALPMTVFSTPTINGYKRFTPYSFAPDRVVWANESRGAMVRVQGTPGDLGAHIENRLGEPAAHPYYYLAANIAAGLDGIRRSLEPPPMEPADPYAADVPLLPRSLGEAVDFLDADSFFRSEFGEPFVNYVTMMKREEVGRFLGAVTDWEMREYFEFF